MRRNVEEWRWCAVREGEQRAQAVLSKEVRESRSVGVWTRARVKLITTILQRLVFMERRTDTVAGPIVNTQGESHCCPRHPEAGHESRGSPSADLACGAGQLLAAMGKGCKLS